MTMNETRQDAWRCAREQAALLLDNDLTHSDVTDAAMTLAAAFRDIDPGDGSGGIAVASLIAPRAVRQHSSDDMDGLGGLADVTDPVAVVLRADGSVDVYGWVAVIDQRGGTS
jgi:hypothetical protein